MTTYTKLKVCERNMYEATTKPVKYEYLIMFAFLERTDLRKQNFRPNKLSEIIYKVRYFFFCE